MDAWRRIPEVEIVAAADLRLERAQKFAAKAYSSAEEMLDREPVDFVDIATHAATHLPMMRLAAERKLPIICQKPIAWAMRSRLASMRSRFTKRAGVSISCLVKACVPWHDGRARRRSQRANNAIGERENRRALAKSELL